jgi:hypothetical protein
VGASPVPRNQPGVALSVGRRLRIQTREIPNQGRSERDLTSGRPAPRGRKPG